MPNAKSKSVRWPVKEAKEKEQQPTLLDGRKIAAAQQGIHDMLQACRGIQHLLQHAQNGGQLDTTDPRWVQLMKDSDTAAEKFGRAIRVVEAPAEMPKEIEKPIEPPAGSGE